MMEGVETLAGLFQKRAREDGFKFLNINDVQWKSFLEKNTATVKSEATLPESFREDPFVQLALMTGRVEEVVIPANTQKHIFKTVEGSGELRAQLTVIDVKENAQLEFVYFHHGDGQNGQQIFSRLYFSLAKNAKVKVTLIQQDARKGQIRACVSCVGEGSEAFIHGLTIGKDSERQDLWVDAVHTVPHTRSDLVAWCMVQDQAHSVFNGRMTIEQTAPFTEAFQKNKNLILSDKASVDSFPKLFIGNNEVKCAHGSSVSSIEPEQLVYLQSRGIDRATAEEMILKGFIRQAIEWISNDETKLKLETVLIGGAE